GRIQLSGKFFKTFKSIQQLSGASPCPDTNGQTDESLALPEPAQPVALLLECPTTAGLTSFDLCNEPPPAYCDKKRRMTSRGKATHTQVLEHASNEAFLEWLPDYPYDQLDVMPVLSPSYPQLNLLVGMTETHRRVFVSEAYRADRLLRSIEAGCSIPPSLSQKFTLPKGGPFGCWLVVRLMTASTKLIDGFYHVGFRNDDGLIRELEAEHSVRIRPVTPFLTGPVGDAGAQTLTYIAYIDFPAKSNPLWGHGPPVKRLYAEEKEAQLPMHYPRSASEVLIDLKKAVQRYMDSLFQTLAVENVVGFREPVEMGFDEEIEHFANNAAVVVRVVGKDHGIDLLGSAALSESSGWAKRMEDCDASLVLEGPTNPLPRTSCRVLYSNASGGIVEGDYDIILTSNRSVVPFMERKGNVYYFDPTHYEEKNIQLLLEKDHLLSVVLPRDFVAQRHLQDLVVNATEIMPDHVYVEGSSSYSRMFKRYRFTLLYGGLDDGEFPPRVLVEAMAHHTIPLVPVGEMKKVIPFHFHMGEAVWGIYSLELPAAIVMLEDLMTNEKKEENVFYRLETQRMTQDVFQYRYHLPIETRLHAHGPEEVSREQAAYGDLVELDVWDTYRNVTLKSLRMFQYVTERWSEAVYFLRVDDDVYLRPIPLLDQIVEHRVPVRYLWGFYDYASVVVRDPDNKKDYNDPRVDYSLAERFPLYVRGNLYVASMDLVRMVVQREAEGGLHSAHPDDPAFGTYLFQLVTLFLMAIIGLILAVGVGSLIQASMMNSRLTTVKSQILKSGYRVEAEDAAASNGSDMAQQLRELRNEVHNLSVYTNVSRFDANMVRSSLSVAFRERVKNAGDSLANHLQARGIDAGYHVGSMRMITWLTKYGVQNYMVNRVVDLVDFGVDGITPFTKGDSCFQIDALRLAIQFGPEADFDGPEFKEFIALFDECIGTSQAVLRDIGNQPNYANFMRESENHPAVLNLRQKVADWKRRYNVVAPVEESHLD
ncbi:hypothetical protein FOZ62_011216, partial [Perkinsus olseni]